MKFHDFIEQHLALLNLFVTKICTVRRPARVWKLADKKHK